MQYYDGKYKLIQKNHSTALPNYIVAFDCETNRTELDKSGTTANHTFRLGVAITARIRDGIPTGLKLHRCLHSEQLFDVIANVSGIKRTVWAIAHNTLFDFVAAGMAEKLERGEMSLSWPKASRQNDNLPCSEQLVKALAVIESPPTIIATKFSQTQGRVVFVDTMNWFPESLAKLGESLGYPKLPMPDFAADNEQWFKYCERDTEIVFRCFVKLMQWVKENDFGMFRYTAPAQAMAAFRHKFMEHKIYAHDDSSIKTLERRGYFGGRTDVFRFGKPDTTVHQLDVSSLFPSVMLRGVYPVAINRFNRSSDYQMHLPQIEWQNSLAECTIKTDRGIYPLRTDKCTVYPIGQFNTVLCGAELAEAYFSGDLRAVKDWVEYGTRPLFTKFIEHLWNLRQDYRRSGNKLYEQFCKRMMNNLYGKFGQMSPSWVNVDSDLSAMPWSRWRTYNSMTHELQEYRSFGWQVQKKVAREEMPGNFPAISAFITADARYRMNKLRQTAGVRNVFYQAIDSLIVNDDGKNRLSEAGEIAENVLGKLRLQGTSDQCVILGINDYMIGSKTAIAGLSTDHSSIENDATMQRRFRVADLMFNHKSLNYIREEQVEWNRVTKYIHGEIDKDGWTRPYYLDDNQAGAVTGSSPLERTPSAISCI